MWGRGKRRRVGRRRGGGGGGEEEEEEQEGHQSIFVVDAEVFWLKLRIHEGGFVPGPVLGCF